MKFGCKIMNLMVGYELVRYAKVWDWSKVKENLPEKRQLKMNIKHYMEKQISNVHFPTC